MQHLIKSAQTRGDELSHDLPRRPGHSSALLRRLRHDSLFFVLAFALISIFFLLRTPGPPHPQDQHEHHRCCQRYRDSPVPPTTRACIAVFGGA
jgi:hypothetical protein